MRGIARTEWTVSLAAFVLVAALPLAAVQLDAEFIKGLISIPSESRSIPECNRAVAYLTNYLAPRGVS